MSDGMNWQPIETAPRDGSDVLLFFPLDGLDHRNHARTVICFWRLNETYPATSGWVFQGRAVRAYSSIYQPTHWMPLPEPPARTPSDRVGEGEK